MVKAQRQKEGTGGREMGWGHGGEPGQAGEKIHRGWQKSKGDLCRLRDLDFILKANGRH
jgi:hypothetical protein